MTADRLDTEITLNQIAQGLVDRTTGLSWFESFSDAEQREVLRMLVYMLLQARANSHDVPAAIEQACLKATFTPCVMLTSGPLNTQLAKAIQLPSNELVKLFSLLIALLRISDNRRKANCGPSCKHWWHADLSNDEIVERIKRTMT